MIVVAPASVSKVVEFAVFAGLYLIFAGTLSPAEIAAAIVTAALALACRIMIARCSEFGFTASGVPVLHLAARAVGRIAADVVRVAAVFIKATFGAARPAGHAHETPFRSGDGEPRDTTRRAVAVALASVSPNSFVIDGGPHDGVIVHELASPRRMRRRQRGDREWLA